MNEQRRKRAARFDHYMDRIDGDWEIPAQLERLARWLYIRLPRVLLVIAVILVGTIPSVAGATSDASYPPSNAPRAVGLSDATAAPSFLRLVPANRGYFKARQCRRGGYWSEVNAYRWNGSELSAQRWNRDGDRTYWRDPRGGRVTFDGVRFHNGTRHPVLVAGWC